MSAAKDSTKAFGSLVGFDVILFLSLLPAAMLVFTLTQQGVLEDSSKALQGDLFMFGLASNLWNDFLPFFCTSIVLFVACSWFAITLLKHARFTSSRYWFKLAFGLALALLASLAFGITTIFASLSYLWFQDRLAFGTVGSPVLFYLSAGFAFIMLVANFYRLHRLESS